MSLQGRVSGRLAQLRSAGQLLVSRHPWPGPLASLGALGPRARTSAGVGGWGAAALGQTAGVRTWAPLAMAVKVDLSTSTDWKEAKCKWEREGRGRPTWGFPVGQHPASSRSLWRPGPLRPIGPR